MNLTFLLCRAPLVLLFTVMSLSAAPEPGANARRMQHWRDSRFGMFIHWGPVSLKGTEIGWSRGAEIPIQEYDNLYRQFNPTNFDADAWVAVAKNAGMKYMVFTTKHHDGFCMFDTRQTDFNVMHSPFGRDVVKELAAACRRQGIEFGTYHSVCDWHHPDFPRTSPGGSVKRENPNLDRYEAYLRAQVKELITNYGPLNIMWFDVPQEFDATRGLALEQWTRSLQPDIIINNRSGAQGDYDTPEQRVGKYQDNRPWETCMTICNQWAWKPNDPMKSLKQCLQTLVLCAGGDGNLLFNVGPTPDGIMEKRQVDRLKEMGSWLRKYGETIYATRGGPWKPTKTFASTRTGNTVYLHVLGGEGTLALPNLPKKLVRSSVLTGGNATVLQGERGIAVSLPSQNLNDIDSIVKLEFESSVMDIPAVSAAPKTEGQTAASNVFQQMADFEPDMAFDNDPETRWATDGGTRQAWISRNFGHPVRFDGVHIDEAYGTRIQKYDFQVKDENGWKTIFSGATIGPGFARKFPAVTAQEIRLNVQDATEGPTITEIQLDEAKNAQGSNTAK